MLFNQGTFEPPRSLRDSTPGLVNELFALPLQAQLGVLRTIAPKILARLHPEQRDGFLRDLSDEIDHALRGAESYDLRSNQPRSGDQPYLEPISGVRPQPGAGSRHGPDVPVEFRDLSRERRADFAQRPASADDAGRRDLTSEVRAHGAPQRWPRGYTRSDERIREDVCEALSGLDDVDVSEVEVAVSQGEVTLTGAVPARSMKYDIESICERVPGVAEIHDRLRVIRSASNPDRRAQRHAARASDTYRDFMRDVVQNLSVTPADAERIVLAVISTLEQRLLPGEAMDLEAQLPSLLQDLLQMCEQPPVARPRDIDRERFIAMIAERLDVRPEQAESWARGVFRTLNGRVTQGEIRQVRNLLPTDIRELWPS